MVVLIRVCEVEDVLPPRQRRMFGALYPVTMPSGVLHGREYTHLLLVHPGDLRTLGKLLTPKAKIADATAAGPEEPPKAVAGHGRESGNQR